MPLHICVYCGAKSGHNADYTATAYELGTAMAARGWRLIYGGGKVGLMGALAQGVRDGGGYTIGIIPEGLLAREQGNIESDELLVTATLRERKGLMDGRADAFMALPGGFGTLEELVETITLRQLGYHNKPIIIFNLGGYYDPLLAFFEHAIEADFIHRSHRTLFSVVASVAEAVAILNDQGER